MFNGIQQSKHGESDSIFIGKDVVARTWDAWLGWLVTVRSDLQCHGSINNHPPLDIVFRLMVENNGSAVFRHISALPRRLKAHCTSVSRVACPPKMGRGRWERVMERWQ